MVDTGQVHRRKGGVRRWRRDAASPEIAPSRLADNQKLLEAILRDNRRPPQSYMRQQSLEETSTEDGSITPRVAARGARGQQASESILGKIDSYLSQVREAKESRRVRLEVAGRAGRPPGSAGLSAGPSRSAPGRQRAPGGQQRPPPAPVLPVRQLVSKKRQLLAGDVMERFPQDFTAKRPFRPQVLRTAASPRLRYLRVYRGPSTACARGRAAAGGARGRRPPGSLSSAASASSSSRHREQELEREQEQELETDGTESEQQRQETDDQEEDGKGEDEEEEEDDDDEENGDEEAEEDEYGNDFEEDEEEQERVSSDEVSSRVPPLSISPDSDQEAWLREQASKALARQRAALALKANHRSPSKDSAYNGGFSSCSRGPTPEEAAGPRPAARQPTAGRTARPTVAPPAPPPPPPPPAPPPPAASKRREPDDEQGYVQFLGEVTSDILARDVYTNRILKRVMAAHVERNRGRLDMNRMLLELGRLRDQLGIPAEDALDETEHGFGSVSDLSSATPREPLEPLRLPTTSASEALIEQESASFVDSLLFPNGDRLDGKSAGRESTDRGRRGARDGAGLLPPGEQQVAPSGGPPESVTTLLASLNLDDSVTQTILNCYKGPTDSVSVSSEELRDCLNWRIPQTDLT